MKPSQNCYDLIKHYESFFPNPYLCPANKPTIGYGTRVYPDGKPVRLTDHAITEAEAFEYLKHDVEKFVADVNYLVKVPLTQSQFDALVSFAYNAGSDIDADTIAEGLGDSTLLKLINQNIMQTAPAWKRTITAEFNKWVKATVKGKRVTLAGLVARRGSEALLFTNDILKFFN